MDKGEIKGVVGELKGGNMQGGIFKGDKGGRKRRRGCFAYVTYGQIMVGRISLIKLRSIY